MTSLPRPLNSGLGLSREAVCGECWHNTERSRPTCEPVRLGTQLVITEHMPIFAVELHEQNSGRNEANQEQMTFRDHHVCPRPLGWPEFPTFCELRLPGRWRTTHDNSAKGPTARDTTVRGKGPCDFVPQILNAEDVEGHGALGAGDERQSGCGAEE